MSRRRRRADRRAFLAHAAVALLVWAILARALHVPGTAATLAAGATFGLLAGWRMRGAFERWVRRLVRRAFWRFGVRVSFPRRRHR